MICPNAIDPCQSPFIHWIPPSIDSSYISNCTLNIFNFILKTIFKISLKVQTLFICPAVALYYLKNNPFLHSHLFKQRNILQLSPFWPSSHCCENCQTRQEFIYPICLPLWCLSSNCVHSRLLGLHIYPPILIVLRRLSMSKNNLEM